jgi:site-specific DNA recombinase
MRKTEIHKPVAALYRVSTLKQAKREDDISIQIAIVQEYAASRGMQIVKEYREEGVSAFHNDTSERIILRQILTDAAAGIFDTLLIFKSDRLSRQSFGYPLYLHELSKRGVRVVSVSEDKELSVDDHTDKLMRFLEGWLAEGESHNKSVHVSAHMKEKAKTGQYLGGRPAYGFSYDKKTKEFAIYEPEADILRFAFDKIFYMGLVEIVKELNSRGLKTRYGKPWAGSVLGRVMRNPIVAGLRAYGKTRATGKGVNRVRVGEATDFDNVIIPRDDAGNPKPDPNLAIINFDTWLAAMKVMEDRRPCLGRSGGRSLNEGLLLTGFARCAECGAPMVTSRYKRKGKNKTTLCENYKCRTQEESGKSVCKGQRYFSAKKIDELFLQELENFLTKLDITELEEHYREKIKAARKEARQESRELERNLRQSKKLLKEWLERLDRFLLDPTSSLYSEDVLASKVKEYEEQTRKIEAQLDRALQDAAVETWENEQIRLFTQLAPRWFDLFRDAPLAQKKQMLNSIVDTVEIGRGVLNINCKLNLIAFVQSAGQSCEEKQELVVPFRLTATV